MYSIDGISLKNPTYGWRLKRDGTVPYSAKSRSLVDFNTSGRDGTIQVRGFTNTPTITLAVTTPETYLDDLKQLMSFGATLTLTGDSSKYVTIELVSLTIEPIALANGGIWKVTGIFRLPAVYWRDTAVSTYGPTSITGSGMTITAFTPTTGPIRDAVFSFGGSITGLAVTGSNGTYFTYSPNIPSGTYLTFDSATGRAWTGGSAFTRGTEVTGQIANGRGPYFLELQSASSPAILGVNYTVTMTGLNGGTAAVRGYNAYDQ